MKSYLERKPKSQTPKRQIESKGCRGQIVTLICVVLATMILLLAIWGMRDYIVVLTQSMIKSAVSNLVVGGLTAIDVANKNLECTYSVSLIDAQEVETRVEKSGALQSSQASVAGNQRLIDIVPYEYQDGKLLKSLMVYETCQLPKLNCYEWSCTKEDANQSTK